MNMLSQSHNRSLSLSGAHNISYFYFVPTFCYLLQLDDMHQVDLTLVEGKKIQEPIFTVDIQFTTRVTSAVVVTLWTIQWLSYGLTRC